VFKGTGLLESGAEGTVVIKRILPEHASDERLRVLFAEEALLLCRLDHPGIVRLLDQIDLEGSPALVLEHVDGVDLGRLLGSTAGGRLPPATAARIAFEIASALAYVDTTLGPTVHRDISPQNVLISVEGEVKLADFGIATWMFGISTTPDGTIWGKLDYLSPEQAEGAADIDARSDVFAVGIVLHEMLFGELPFRGATDIEVLARVLDCRYVVPPGLEGPDLALAGILERCIVRERAARFASAEALAAALGAFLEGYPARPERSQLAELAQDASSSSQRTASAEADAGGNDQASPPRASAPPLDPTRPAPTVPPIPPILVPGPITASIRMPLPPVPPERPSWRRGWPLVLALAAAGVIGGVLAHSAVPATSRLSVETLPGMEVLVDGRSLGVAPLHEVALPPGPSELVIRDASGRTLLRRTLHLEAGRSVVVPAVADPAGATP
jgi:serine/threonine-protein kinase